MKVVFQTIYLGYDVSDATLWGSVSGEKTRADIVEMDFGYNRYNLVNKTTGEIICKFVTGERIYLTQEIVLFIEKYVEKAISTGNAHYIRYIPVIYPNQEVDFPDIPSI